MEMLVSRNNQKSKSSTMGDETRVEVVRAAGVVPWRRAKNGDIEVLLIHRPRYDDWSVPKGKVDPGEDEEACAVREMREETGIVGELGEPLPTALYTDHKSRPKEVSYWLMRVGDIDSVEADDFVPNDEVDELRWAAIDDARALLSYPLDRTLLDEALLVLSADAFAGTTSPAKTAGR